MADLYDPAFTFALGLERPVAASWRLGLQAGYHEFDAETGLAIDNLGIVNLSLYGKLLGSAGSLRPFAVLGPGAYRVGGSWEPGVLVGLGVEVPVTTGVALTTGATAHFVRPGGDEADLDWIDGGLGFLFELP